MFQQVQYLNFQRFNLGHYGCLNLKSTNTMLGFVEKAVMPENDNEFVRISEICIILSQWLVKRSSAFMVVAYGKVILLNFQKCYIYNI